MKTDNPEIALRDAMAYSNSKLDRAMRMDRDQDSRHRASIMVIEARSELRIIGRIAESLNIYNLGDDIDSALR